MRERDLDDCVHDVFVAVYKRLPDFDPSRAIRPWLFGFSFRIASDYRARAHHRRETVEADVDAVDEAPTAEAQFEASERRALVTAALDKIEMGRRAVFVMCEIDGCAVPEIAMTLGIPLNTAYSRLRLARDEFANAVRALESRREGTGRKR